MPPARLPDDAMVVASADLLATTFGEETVILNVADGKYYGLDGVGARIWSLLAQPVTVGTLLQTLTTEYDVDPDRCARDLRSLLQRLASQGLVEMRPPR